MNKEKVKLLLKKQEKDELSTDEQLRLNQWYLNASIDSKDSLNDEQLKQSYDFLKARLPLVSAVKTVKLWPRILAVAASIAIVLFGIWFFSNEIDILNSAQEKVVYINDIAPGKIGATLTLANGKKINLSDVKNGELVEEESGVLISKTADGQILYEVKVRKNSPAEFNTLETGNGEQIRVILPDQSIVFLNAASSIRYSSNFSNLKERKVELSGEAYFEIAKDKSHPFIVKSSDQEIKVLGTHFNVNAYPKERLIKTTLLEGAVTINDGKVLKPGQLAINNHTNVMVREANISLETAWVDNYFAFDEESTESVMRKIARWYNITVTYSNEKLKYIPLNGRISRTKSLSTVLERIGTAANIRFTIKDRNVIVD